MYMNEEEFVQVARDYDFKGMKMTDPCIQGLKMYLYHKIPAGSFLHSILTNDLKGAAGRADSNNIYNIPAYVAFMYNYFPSEAWGSVENVNAWLNRKEL